MGNVSQFFCFLLSWNINLVFSQTEWANVWMELCTPLVQAVRSAPLLGTVSLTRQQWCATLQTSGAREKKGEKRADSSMDFILCQCDNLKLGAELCEQPASLGAQSKIQDCRSQKALRGGKCLSLLLATLLAHNPRSYISLFIF